MNFGQQLKEARVRAGMTQIEIVQQLAVKEGLSLLDTAKIKNKLVSISAWENNKNMPDGLTLIRLQDMLNVVFTEKDSLSH
jgi:transcriptional regulator with XRE-family HTH domain